MKKIILLVIVAFLFINISNAQFFQKGSVFADGSLGFSSYSGDLYTSNGKTKTKIDIEPGFSFCVADNFLIGANLIISSTSQGDAKSSQFGIIPHIGYAFSGESIYPYLRAGLGYIKQTSNSGASGAKDETISGTSIMIGGGVIFKVNDFVGITTGISYTSDSFKWDGASSSDSGNIFMIDVGFIIKIK